MKEIAPAVVIAVAPANVAEVVAGIVLVNARVSAVMLAEASVLVSVVVHAQGSVRAVVMELVLVRAGHNAIMLAEVSVEADVLGVACMDAQNPV